MRNPQEQDWPEGRFDKATIKLQYDSLNKKWSAYCPEWQCELHGDSMTEAATAITRDIDNHNAIEEGQ